MPKVQQKKFQENLLTTLNGFRKMKEMFGLFSTTEPKCKLLHEIISSIPPFDPLFESLEVLVALEANDAGSIRCTFNKSKMF